ncbi:MAG: TIGR03364 family FAD-dependent oxidoreductase [Leptothrix sp. (in: b-proteobacteria)]
MPQTNTDRDTQFDVIVVGAGIVGLAHAHVAASRGLSVCVVERDAACMGASVRNFGLITVSGQRSGDTWRRARRSRDTWAEIAPQAGIEILQRGLWLRAERPLAREVLQQFMSSPKAEACTLLSPAEARVRAPELQLDGVQAVLHSPHELRVESHTAIGRLTRWLARALGVRFRFGEAVLEVEVPRVRTSRTTLHAERVVVCTHSELNGLFAPQLQRHALALCQLQMLRVQPEAGFRLSGAVMTDLSLIRYPGYSAQPAAVALRAQLEAEEAAVLSQGIHLIAVQSADGSLVVGDSHRYAAPDEALDWHSDPRIDALILDQLQRTLRLRQAHVTARWTGVYPSAAQADCLIEAPDAATRVVLVTSGTGASTAFGIAEDVFAAW